VRALPSWDPWRSGCSSQARCSARPEPHPAPHRQDIRRRSGGTALAGTLLYFLNFAVHNKHLGCGLVDSGESSLMLALYWLLFARKLSCCPSSAFWARSRRRRSFRWQRSQRSAGLPWTSATGAGTLRWRFGSRDDRRRLSVNVLLQYAAYDRLILPWQFAAQIRDDPWARDVSLLGLIGCLTDRQFWYIFGWLLPLGALR
jgi:hypothetical protein